MLDRMLNFVGCWISERWIAESIKLTEASLKFMEAVFSLEGKFRQKKNAIHFSRKQQNFSALLSNR